MLMTFVDVVNGDELAVKLLPFSTDIAAIRTDVAARPTLAKVNELTAGAVNASAAVLAADIAKRATPASVDTKIAEAIGPLATKAALAPLAVKAEVTTAIGAAVAPKAAKTDVDAIAARVTAAEGKAATQTNRLNDQGDRLDTAEKALTSLTTRVTAAEKLNADQATALTAAATRLAAAEKKAADQAAVIATLAVKADVMADIDALKARILPPVDMSPILARLDALDARLAALEPHAL